MYDGPVGLKKLIQLLYRGREAPHFSVHAVVLDKAFRDGIGLFDAEVELDHGGAGVWALHRIKSHQRARTGLKQR